MKEKPHHNSKIKKLPKSFYDRDNVVQIAKDLIGKIVVTHINGIYTSGRIVETEAYIGITDRASHSFGGRRTARNEQMYAAPGTAYIYICYGIHQMLNVVTNKAGIPDAILIRAIEPLEGIKAMLERTGKKELMSTLTSGPGNVGKALGIFKHFSGTFLMDDLIYLGDDGFHLMDEEIGISKRIGVESAGEDAKQPFRFYLKNNRFVSGKRT